MKDFYIIGVMSGTSIDGLDLVYAKFVFEESWKFKIISTKTYEYDNEWQVILKSIVKNNIESVKQIDQNYTRLLSEYILQFINEYNISKIDFVSSHGHTAFHDPSNSLTYQLGNLPELSNYLGL
ncbi:MAG: anhydro-N-acetylmuramic acid kinase, partial [Flavobacteriaceae bacterium]|nr:anhydro-N-acetylmuramic acid kinase [Flavobacteriaceae bacterium]